MKNFEKYEKEIKEAGKEHLFWKDINKISNGYVRSEGTFIEWLYSESKELLLTDEEREYLDIFIEPFRNKIDYIRFYSDSVDIFYKENCYVSYDLKLPIKMCKANLKLGKDYSLEELGL